MHVTPYISIYNPSGKKTVDLPRDWGRSAPRSASSSFKNHDVGVDVILPRKLGATISEDPLASAVPPM